MINMKKYKVTLELMEDPSKGDATFERTYHVEADSEYGAYLNAEAERENDDEEVRYNSVFNYTVKEMK